MDDMIYISFKKCLLGIILTVMTGIVFAEPVVLGNVPGLDPNARYKKSDRWCKIEKGKLVKNVPSALCCKDENGKLVTNPKNSRKNNIICCGNADGKGDKSQRSYSSLVSKAHTFYNEIASIVTKIQKLEQEKDKLIEENKKKNIDPKALDIIEAKISDLNKRKEFLTEKIQDILSEAKGLSGQVDNADDVKQLKDLASKLDVDGKVSCIRGDGSACL